MASQDLYIRWCESQRVTVLVGGAEGNSEVRAFQIPGDFLRHRSAPFRQMLDGNHKEDKESLISLPETSVATFKVFYVWSMNLEPHVDPHSTQSLLVDIVTFATKYLIFALHNQAIDLLEKKITDSQSGLKAEEITRIYDSVGEESKLRKLTRASLGRLKQTDSADQLKETFLACPELGWDFFEAERKGGNSWRSRYSEPCEFHEHDGPPLPVGGFQFGQSHYKDCPHAGKECFPQEHEEPSRMVVEVSSKKAKKHKKKRASYQTMDEVEKVVEEEDADPFRAEEVLNEGEITA